MERMRTSGRKCGLEIGVFSVGARFRGAFFELLQIAEASDRQNIAFLEINKSIDIVNLV